MGAEVSGNGGIPGLRRHAEARYLRRVVLFSDLMIQGHQRGELLLYHEDPVRQYQPGVSQYPVRLVQYPNRYRVAVIRIGFPLVGCPWHPSKFVGEDPVP